MAEGLTLNKEVAMNSIIRCRNWVSSPILFVALLAVIMVFTGCSSSPAPAPASTPAATPELELVTSGARPIAPGSWQYADLPDEGRGSGNYYIRFNILNSF